MFHELFGDPFHIARSDLEVGTMGPETRRMKATIRPARLSHSHHLSGRLGSELASALLPTDPSDPGEVLLHTRVHDITLAAYVDRVNRAAARSIRQSEVTIPSTRRSAFRSRISLEDAAVGDELLLLPYVHLPAASPYRTSGPIFVRRGAQRRTLEPGEIPPYVTRRLISVRAYDVDHMMIDAGVCDGTLVAEDIAQRFDDERVAFIHLHNAKRGCFSCRVDRA